MLIFVASASAQNIMQINDASVAAGSQVEISINITNADAFVGFQLDIPLPSAVSYVNNSALLVSERSNGHSLSTTLMTGNILRIIAFSFNNTPFSGNSGAVARFKLNAGNIPGSYTLAIQNALIASTSTNIMTGSINGTLTIQAPNIQVNPANQDFGSIPLGGYSDRNFTIQNTGNQTLNVSNITFNSPHFINQSASSFSLSAGQSQNITVRFNSTVKGTYSKTMSVASNDPDQPITSINLTAIAFAVNELHTGSMVAPSGTQATLEFTINNMENFVGFQFDLSLPTPLSYVAGSVSLTASRVTDHHASVNMINSSTLRVIGFSPSNTPFLGDDGKIVSLSFDVNGTGGWYPLNINSVIIGDLNGDNVVSASTNGSLTITAPDIHANSNLSFGDVAVNETGNSELTIYNYGQEALIINTINFTNSVFSNLTSLPITIQSYENTQLQLKYNPIQSGQSTGSMRIYSNDPNENPFLVSLSANAFSPNYLTVQDLTASPGTQATLAISAENYEDFVGFQFDLTLPEGATYVPGSALLAADRKQDHTLSVSQLENGSLRFLCFSMNQLAFRDNEGTLVQLAVAIDEAMGEGNYQISMANAFLGNSASSNILYAANNGTLEIVAQQQLAIAVLLEGPFDGTNAMNASLKNAGLLPLAQPYNSGPWNYTGTEQAVSLGADIVDWVLVELRDADAPENATSSTIVEGWPKAMLLKSDGNIVDFNGNTPSIASPSVSDNLYLVIRHRNHLDVMSSESLVLAGNTYSYDFTDDISKAYGGVAGYKAIGNGKYGMVAGDIDADGAVLASDFNVWAINFGLITIYLPADVDMDGQVLASDFNKWAVNFGTNPESREVRFKSQVPD
ncbi:MAG: choice-of-anchor D domain-containing protein [Bacteroidales bacterium]|nr:choice-of-anchor D domain-containing protein [Bacteroidales bacterium]